MEAQRDAIIAALTPVVDGIAATFGPVCEVVLHDYRRPEKSVVAVAGSVTGRAVGGAMSEIGMRVLARGDEAGDELNYLTRTGNGRLVKSSTMVLRDATGAVFGALCVNLDAGAVQQAQALLGALAGVGAGPVDAVRAPVTTFGNDIDSVVDAIVDAHRLRQHQSWAGLDRAERLALFRSLDEHGVFAVRRAVEQVAARLGISRASAYNYLAQARSGGESGAGPTAGGAAAGPSPEPPPESATTAAASQRPTPVTTTAPTSEGPPPASPSVTTPAPTSEGARQ
ncbi:helix-turn-helix transcriptional regulator [Streptomyces chromofuscus]|uniref:helix-turn-helix transcriptional regulator n=1 Tax=Streptomyces chromofuscus TaxID=42881 RepID=UPI001D141D45|nr:PAS domain-containing protein [Streptomyces chromofuscus]